METWLSLQRNVSISSAAPRPADWGLFRTRFPFPTAHPQHPRCAHNTESARGETRSRAQRWGRNIFMPSAVLGMLQLGWLAFFFFWHYKNLYACTPWEWILSVHMHGQACSNGCMELRAWSCKQRGNFLHWADPTQLLKLFPTHPNHVAFPLVQHIECDQLLGPAPSLKLI